MSIDTQLTALTRARYNRLAPIYDWLEAFVEAFSFRRWRERLWRQVKGQKILEVPASGHGLICILLQSVV